MRPVRSRRAFLQLLGGVGGAALLVGCSRPSPGRSPSPTSPAPTPSPAELEHVRVCAAVEILLIAAYDAVLSPADGASTGQMPASVTAGLSAARREHSRHLDAWNGLLRRQGASPQSAADGRLEDGVRTELAQARTGDDVLRLCLRLEMVSLETSVAAASTLADAALRLTALRIAPVEARHAAILNLLLGRDPVPDSQVRGDLARQPDDLRD